MIIAGTGHRPDKLGGYDDAALERLWNLAYEWLEKQEGVTEVVSGMALGWDTALALAALDHGLPLVAAVPFAGQEVRWPKEAQKRHRYLLGKATETVFVCSSGYAGWKMQARNRWMVDRADKMVALWNGGEDGGTANCIRYAESVKKPVVNLWGDFLKAGERANEVQGGS